MAGKKTKHSLESILTRAEKLFRRGNYPLARKEFDKVLKGMRSPGSETSKIADQEDIAEKIRICASETKRLKAEDLVKRAKKYARKSNPQQAIRYFEQAYEISGEDWIREKIDRLHVALRGRDVQMRARDAEAEGEYVKASELYDEAFLAQGREDFLLRKACCLVKAERYGEAIPVFRDSDLSSHHEAMYNYGFALARVGDYYKCLRVWDGIASHDSGFAEQKEDVRSLLAADLRRRIENTGDLSAIYEQGRYLLNSTDGQGPGRDIDKITAYSMYGWIKELWRQERFETIAELIRELPDDMSDAMLALQARTCFKLAEKSAEHLADMSMFWLTALYGEVFARFSSGIKDADKVREKLTRLAEDLVTRHVDSKDAARKKILACWNIEKRVVRDIHALVGDRQDLLHLVCTPGFAMRFDRSAQVLKLIRNNKDFFKDTNHYLLTGSYYSRAAESLFCIESGEYDKAIAALPDENGNDSLDYGVRKVKFAYGLHCIEHGEAWPVRYMESATALFDTAPEYEKKLVDKALATHEFNEWCRYEEALAEIHKKRPSRQIDDALSLVMSWRAVGMYNRDRMNDKTLEIVLKKALILNPENEYAIGNLNETQIDLEKGKLAKALETHKMNKACRMAVESEYPEVRDDFFVFFEHLIKSFDTLEINNNDKTLLLKDIYGWCASVDQSHPILYEIGDMLETGME